MLVEDKAAKRAYQRKLEVSVRARLKPRGVRNIGFPSGNRDEIVHAAGEGGLWSAFGDAEDAKIPRWWNAFGVFAGGRSAQSITVEINIPTNSNSAAVAGFFAQDPSSEAVYLMHDGGVGGGKSGVGRTAFLAWSGRRLTPVSRSGSDEREGIVVGRVGSPDLADRIWKYVLEVRAFKDAVAAGALETPAMKRRLAEWDQYRHEGSGRRHGVRTSQIDYFSYHGDVVHAVWMERSARKIRHEIVTRSPLVDLLVRKRDTVTEVYEFKTALDRQSLYTAIGQVLTHFAASDGALRTLVLPEGDLPADVRQCLDHHGIAVRRFRLEGRPEKRTVVLIT